MKYKREGIDYWKDKEWLYNQYITLDKTTKQISEECGCNQHTIQCWLAKHKIKKHPEYTKSDVLYNLHINENMSIPEIARKFNITPCAVEYQLKKNNIPIHKVFVPHKCSDEEVTEIIRLYSEEKLSTPQIANKFGITNRTVGLILKKNGIKIRTIEESLYNRTGREKPKELNDKVWLYTKHWIENFSCKDIGELLGVEPAVVRRNMHKLGLLTRNNSQSKFVLYMDRPGVGFKGGVTYLKDMLRRFFTYYIVPKIKKRDGYICKLCGSKKELHVHHIKSFSDIVEEICNEHSELDLDNVEDRFKAYDIVIHDSRFLSEDNLITYCRECHLYKIHKFSKSVFG